MERSRLAEAHGACHAPRPKQVGEVGRERIWLVNWHMPLAWSAAVENEQVNIAPSRVRECKTHEGRAIGRMRKKAWRAPLRKLVLPVLLLRHPVCGALRLNADCCLLAGPARPSSVPLLGGARGGGLLGESLLLGDLAG